MKHCLIVFAKEPEKGRVKTRLVGYLSNDKCLNLYKAFLKDTIELVKKIKSEVKIIAFTSEKKPDYLKNLAPNFTFYKQRGRNLGMRMHNAFKFATKNNTASLKAVIIGADSPLLPAHYIKKAFQQLDKRDIVLGPSCDGGYYLIGLKKTCLSLFKGIKWSSMSVFGTTLQNAKRLGKSTAILDECYDVDDRESLVRLAQDLKKQKNKNIAQWTRRFLKI